MRLRCKRDPRHPPAKKNRRDRCAGPVPSIDVPNATRSPSMGRLRATRLPTRGHKHSNRTWQKRISAAIILRSWLQTSENFTLFQRVGKFPFEYRILGGGRLRGYFWEPIQQGVAPQRGNWGADRVMSATCVVGGTAVALSHQSAGGASLMDFGNSGEALLFP
jgi:hypothetical protein